MEYRILGPLEVAGDGTLAALGPPKQRSLLAILLLHANEIVPSERLVDLLWGERPPRTAAHSVQIYVSELRKSIEPLAGEAVILTRPPGYQLRTEVETIDARRFERLVTDGIRDRRDQHPRGSELLREALALWRGPALGEFAYEEFAQPDIRRLADLRVAALEELAGAELDAGRAQEALPLVEVAIREDPLRERPRELLMLALYRTGRHAEALRAFQAFREQLADELGLDPSPALRRLQERILLHDPALVPATPDLPDPPVAGRAPARNPYKGLRPFAEADAEDFFGRDGLVDRLVEAVLQGDPVIALVGPSGSGKSSVVAAGLIPALRTRALQGSDRWRIVLLSPGPRPMEALEDALTRGVEQSAPSERLILVMDQFEDVFSIADEAVRTRFLETLATAVSDPEGRAKLILTLRADFYDRPLLHPAFAEVFTPGVVNVVPMTASELEIAVVGPADRVGVAVEATLVAELLADTAGQPGALPILQYALTELFDRQEGDALWLADYRALGGLRGLLSRRAEELYGRLDAEAQGVARQVFLRLVHAGRASNPSRRRAQVTELSALDFDPVALSDVLGRFGRARFLSFDRDDATGDATVEVAHEALLWEWERLSGWIEQYRTWLRKHDGLVAAMEDWELSGRDPDYLLSGGRLVEYEAWGREGPLQLTRPEREFLDAGLDRRRAEDQHDQVRREGQRRVERRSRRRLIGMVVALVLLAGTAAYGSMAWMASRPPEAILLDPRGAGVFGDQATVGFERAAADLGIRAVRVAPPGELAAESDVRAAADSGAKLVVLPAIIDCSFIDSVAQAYPDVRFVVFARCAIGQPNVVYVRWASEQGSFLAGAAAALTSKTGVIGFIGGVDEPLIWAFHAGYEAGARAVNPEIEVRWAYLSEPPDISGFDAAPRALQVAGQMYENGADVIFPAAGGSGFGVFEAARQLSDRRQVWALGVDVDQYDPHDQGYAAHVLTSMVLVIDKVTYTLLTEHAQGTLRPGLRMFDLADGGVDITYSGGYLDGVRPQIEALRDQIISGEIVVPCLPAVRAADPDLLESWGIDPDNACASLRAT